jgi:hypothetical protein
VITEKGMRWLNASPRELRDPALSRRLEELCRVPVEGEESSPEPWKVRFGEVMRQVPEGPRRQALAAMEAYYGLREWDSMEMAGGSRIA